MKDVLLALKMPPSRDSQTPRKRDSIDEMIYIYFTSLDLFKINILII